MSNDAIPEDLQQRAFSGDPKALRELLVLHLPMLVADLDRGASNRLRARETPDDLAQSLAGDLLAELGDARFTDLAAFRAWLHKTAQNKLVDKERFHRAQRRDVQREVAPADGTTASPMAPRDRGPSPSLLAIGRERQEALERALQQLPAEQQQVVRMARLQGLPHAEIAAALGKSEPACRMLLRRALVALAALLDRPDDSS